MKRWKSSRSICGITLIELLVVIAIIVVLFAMLLPRFGPRPQPSRRVACMSNLRQVGIGEEMWFSDHSNQHPWQITAANGGTLEASARGEITPNVRTLGEYIKYSKIFRCPADTARIAATNYTTIAETNVSYFIHLDSSTNVVSSVLMGDRNLVCDGKAVSPGLLSLTATNKLGWTRELHGKSQSVPVPGGNLMFADIHVEWKPDPSAVLLRADGATNRLAIP
jgi:type II secretory pathway pseudopilin PulG